VAQFAYPIIGFADNARDIVSHVYGTGGGISVACTLPPERPDRLAEKAAEVSAATDKLDREPAGGKSIPVNVLA
jgi:hypothetical protein